MKAQLQHLISQFDIPQDMAHHSAVPYGEGHINDTFLVQSNRRCILQRINHQIFTSPDRVMENILAVTTHLRDKILQAGGDPWRETLTVIPTTDGKPFYQAADGNYYRMYVFIEDAKTYQYVEKPEHFFHAAKAFGKFQKMLADFPAQKLHEIIPNFHNTKVRFEALERAIAADTQNRVKDVQAEIEFAMARKQEAGKIVDAMDAGKIPVRVTHNDTKYNNIMIDDKTGEGLCVIDLDTVMPGCFLYDYGDAIRSGCNPVAEDEKDLSLVKFDMTLFEQFTKGYLQEMHALLTPTEIEMLALSAKLMTYECGTRFLADYLSGDTYFKTAYDTHNLDRARTQFKMVQDMEQQMDNMNGYIKTILKQEDEIKCK